MEQGGAGGRGGASVSSGVGPSAPARLPACLRACKSACLHAQAAPDHPNPYLYPPDTHTHKPGLLRGRPETGSSARLPAAGGGYMESVRLVPAMDLGLLLLLLLASLRFAILLCLPRVGLGLGLGLRLGLGLGLGGPCSEGMGHSS